MLSSPRCLCRSEPRGFTHHLPGRIFLPAPVHRCIIAHKRVVEKIPDGRIIRTGQFVHDDQGNPDMNMNWEMAG